MRSCVVRTIGLGTALLAAASTARAGYVYDATDFATQVVSYSGPLDPRPAYNDPTAILGQPALVFNNSTINPNIQDIRRAKIIEPPFHYGPGDATTRRPVVTVLPSTASVVVKMGRAITNNRRNPHGADLIVFGNSFYPGTGAGPLDDSTNLNSYVLGSNFAARPVDVAVSPNNAHWFSFPTLIAGIQPYNAYKWNRNSASWTDEQLDPTVPLNPAVYAADYAGDSAADLLDDYGASAGGTALDLALARDSSGETLAENGYSSIQYVRFSSVADDYAVIAGVSAVRPRLSIPTKMPKLDFPNEPWGSLDSPVSARSVPEPLTIAPAAVLLAVSIRRRRAR
jgi:hypothetical protein